MKHPVKHSFRLSFLFRLFLFLSFLHFFGFDSWAEVPCEQRLDLSLAAQLEGSRFEDWNREDRIFSDSVGATTVSAVAWMTAVQLLKKHGLGIESAGVFTPAFALTVPIDVALTVISHAISLGKIPWLKRWQNATRSVFNIVQGTIVIQGAWYLAGIDLSWEHLGAASGLCSVVYPTLQFVKRCLYDRLPTSRDRTRLEAFQNRFESEGLAPVWSDWESRAIDRAKTLGLSEDRARGTFLYTMDALVLSRPISPTNHENWQSTARERRQMIYQALNEWESGRWGDDPEKIDGPSRNILDLGAPFDMKSSVLFLTELRKRRSGYRAETIAASLVDQAIAVGVAGGIFLYGVNHWAVTGETPWFLVNLIGS